MPRYPPAGAMLCLPFCATRSLLMPSELQNHTTKTPHAEGLSLSSALPYPPEALQGWCAAPGRKERQIQLQTCCKEGNLLRMQPVALHQRAKALLHKMKPARAGVRCRASAEPHLTANAGRCECYSRARMRTAGSTLATGGASDSAMLRKWSP